MLLRKVVATAAVAVLLTACGEGAGGDDGRLQVVTTVSPITNIVENVAGDRAAIIGIVPEGTNSHTFEPAPTDAAVMERADIVFINGLHLEEPTRELAEGNLQEGVPLVQLADRTISEGEYIFDFSFPESGGFPNPHLWTNPPYAKEYASIVRDELSTLDPEGAEVYRRNHDAFVERIDALDAAIREATATVPEEDRKLLTYHDSFPYFSREYGWEVVGAIQPSDFAEPTPQDVARLIDQIRAEDIPAIFGSEVFPSPVLDQIAAETGATYVDDLRDDDLPGEPRDPDHTYLGLMAFDLRTIVEALGGDPSPFDAVDVGNVAPADADYRS
jgi:ABC-type Zn uptake system ZnuABC Zn-binding protein ZnuA